MFEIHRTKKVYIILWSRVILRVMMMMMIER